MKYFILLFLIVLWMSASGAKKQFAYSVDETGLISEYNVSRDGRLTKFSALQLHFKHIKEENPYPPRFNLIYCPKYHIVYVSLLYQPYGEIWQFRIIENGRLKPAKSLPIIVNSSIDKPIISPQKNYIIVPTEDRHLLTYGINQYGQLYLHWTKNFEETFSRLLFHDDIMIGATQHSQMNIDPFGKFFLNCYFTGFVDHSEENFTTYLLSPTGEIGELINTVFHNNGYESDADKVGQLSFLPNSQYAYISTFGKHIAAYKFSNKGAFLPLDKHYLIPDLSDFSSRLIIAPKKRYLYSTDYNGYVLCKIKQNGTLKLVHTKHMQFSEEAIIDFHDKNFYSYHVDNYGKPQILQYKILSNGDLKLQSLNTTKLKHFCQSLVFAER